MSQVSKFKSKLALSLSLLMVSSGAALAQDAAGDRPAMSYSGQAAAESPAPKAAANKAAKKPARKTAAKSKDAQEPAAEKLTFAAPLPNEVEVSDRDYNHFIFPKAIKQLVFPPNAPVAKPVYLNDNLEALIEVQRGTDKPIQMIVETESGRVSKFYLKPRPINGITHRVDGAREVSIASRQAPASAQPGGVGSPHAADIELLKRAVQGDVPAEFEAIALPRPTRFDRFTVVPLAGWTDGARRIMHFSLVAVPGKTAVVSDPQFYRPGITAVLLTGDHVDEESNPQLFVVEEVANDE